MDDSCSTVQASLFFLTPDELHKQQRPYTFKFPPYNGCPQSNMTHEKINGITVENMRGREDQFQLERNGFTILKVNTGLEYDDFFKQKEVTQYLHLMEGVLKAHLGASRIRKRHPMYPVSDGTAYEYDQPTTVVHVGKIAQLFVLFKSGRPTVTIDTSREGTIDEIRRQYGKEADGLLKKRFQWIK
ncbi:putative CmcJ-like methyltransferase [Aspergillus fischeri NRRL 181]|uniref:Uncharacterized protein n=1 Tax=Neosartorya fischeri (strain ATCC 1020 / DSM 3700 / CBS 544.65 / FGSC A1164 / JCM 1740 / NRRL 181 / WB 181) TaxID=331117 RepID=A1DAH5_NEOFI|nr:uncharacterized protein NFIA_094850 [Aspergillus fischeri NRRL 181]EAW19865.1 hypothetical protein NFIA_094850 [Aspergillus fischeri NRRL 181]